MDERNWWVFKLEETFELNKVKVGGGKDKRVVKEGLIEFLPKTSGEVVEASVIGKSDLLDGDTFEHGFCMGAHHEVGCVRLEYLKFSTKIWAVFGEEEIHI